MAYLLRQVSRSTEGREIVRSKRIEGDRLTLGRDPAADVHLTDLAVALRHASVNREGGRLAVEAGEGLKVEINGRKLASGSIELGTGGDLRIASHVLRFMPNPAGSDEVAVDVERTTGGEVQLDPPDERMFSLASVMPTKRGSAWILAVLVLGLFLAWPIKAFYDRQEQQQSARKFHPDEMWSSGRLSQVHAQLENDCQACHVKPFEAVRDQSCQSCHTKVHDHADPYRLARAQPDLTRWGRIELAFKEAFDIPPGRCVECHTEHEGKQAMPVTAQRFCSDCHQDLKAKLPDTRLANAGDFGTSHPEFRPSVLTQWNGDRPMLQRVAPGAGAREMSNLIFSHAMHLSKTNGVAQMARRLGGEYGFGAALECKDCHDATPDGVRFQPVAMEEDCGMCHSLAFDRVGDTLRTLRHGEPEQVIADLHDFYRATPVTRPPNFGARVRRRPGDVMVERTGTQFSRAAANPQRADMAIRAVFSRGGACYDCHQVVAPGGKSLDFKIRPIAFPVRYMHHGWFDHKPHETESCSSCHKAGQSNAASDLLLPDLASCRTCHGGESAAKQVQSSCAMCHDYHMDTGAPSMLIRQKVRGKRRDRIVASAEPARTTAGR